MRVLQWFYIVGRVWLFPPLWQTLSSMGLLLVLIMVLMLQRPVREPLSPLRRDKSDLIFLPLPSFAVLSLCHWHLLSQPVAPHQWRH